MKRELGDVLWYWCQGCMALGYTPEEVIRENISKLENDTRMVLRLCVAMRGRRHIMELINDIFLLPWYSFNYLYSV